MTLSFTLLSLSSGSWIGLPNPSTPINLHIFSYANLILISSIPGSSPTHAGADTKMRYQH
jgi:hypothetical protein